MFFTAKLKFLILENEVGFCVYHVQQGYTGGHWGKRNFKLMRWLRLRYFSLQQKLEIDREFFSFEPNTISNVQNERAILLELPLKFEK